MNNVAIGDGADGASQLQGKLIFEAGGWGWVWAPYEAPPAPDTSSESDSDTSSDDSTSQGSVFGDSPEVFDWKEFLFGGADPEGISAPDAVAEFGSAGETWDTTWNSGVLTTPRPDFGTVDAMWAEDTTNLVFDGEDSGIEYEPIRAVPVSQNPEEDPEPPSTEVTTEEYLAGLKARADAGEIDSISQTKGVFEILLDGDISNRPSQGYPKNFPEKAYWVLFGDTDWGNPAPGWDDSIFGNAFTLPDRLIDTLVPPQPKSPNDLNRGIKNFLFSLEIVTALAGGAAFAVENAARRARALEGVADDALEDAARHADEFARRPQPIATPASPKTFELEDGTSVEVSENGVAWRPDAGNSAGVDTLPQELIADAIEEDIGIRLRGLDLADRLDEGTTIARPVRIPTPWIESPTPWAGPPVQEVFYIAVVRRDPAGRTVVLIERFY